MRRHVGGVLGDKVDVIAAEFVAGRHRAKRAAQHTVGVLVKLGVHQTKRRAERERLADLRFSLDLHAVACGLLGVDHVGLRRVDRVQAVDLVILKVAVKRGDAGVHLAVVPRGGPAEFVVP